MGNNIKFEETAKNLLKGLNERSRNVIERRFGIGSESKKQTLESIGQSYGITRERVRQIEAASIDKMRSDPRFKDAETLFGILESEIKNRGGVVNETEFIKNIANEHNQDNNYIYFFLVLGKQFDKLGEDDDFHARWSANKEMSDNAHSAIKRFVQTLKEEPMNEQGVVNNFSNQIVQTASATVDENGLLSWLSISKKISRNHLGEWGHISSPMVRPRGVRDLAYLVLKKHGSPMHFSEVALTITKNLGEPAHTQTVHNELIKDDRFVLVGRGLYALSSWGYKSGAVKDIIASMVKENGPLMKDEIIKRVLKERHVKENTILINLQNKKYFKKLSGDKYGLV